MRIQTKAFARSDFDQTLLPRSNRSHTTAVDSADGDNQSYFQDVNFEVIPAQDRDAKIAELLEAGYTRQQAEQNLAR